jgi:hypothetical protein
MSLDQGGYDEVRTRWGKKGKKVEKRKKKKKKKKTAEYDCPRYLGMIRQTNSMCPSTKLGCDVHLN